VDVQGAKRLEGRLGGKVAVVTGGASGMGLTTVERFVAEGAHVVFTDLPAGARADLEARLGDAAAVHYRDREPGGPHDGFAIADRLGATARFVPADVTVPAELGAVFDTAVRDFGGIDVLVNNAGVGAVEGPITQCPDHLFDRVVDIDLKAVWRGIKLAAPHMADRGGGSIISTGSVAGLRGVPGMGSYSAAKGGVIALTRVAAVELASDGIRVNCICPGAIVTPIIYESPMLDASFDPDMLRVALTDAQPLRRAGEPDDVANLVLFLASDESSFITGQIIAVDGGASAEADARTRTQTVDETLGLG
jgi:NAD(P)-dependent dehydrogenase (short-subunit alcohol dehydrogenase family)